jgi:hypothetical protein
MRTVVVYPGRFHPFHRGHKASYDYLTRSYGDKNVFVVSSDKQDPETSPFSFADKLDMMTKLGISPGQVAQVRNPYQAQEIRSEIDDPENTVLIFAVSEKDMSGEDARFSFGAKKNGEPSYMQPLPPDGKGMQNMTKHAYVAVTPTVNFRVRGADANSASQIRKEYIAGNNSDRDQIIADLYGDVDPGIRDIFDRKLGTGQAVQTVSESHHRIAQKINHLKEMIAQLKETKRQPLDFDQLYGHAFKITDNNGNSDNEGFSIVTPLNGNSWNWRERPEFKEIVAQKLNDPGFLSDYKYQQIIDSVAGKKFDPAKHLAKESEDYIEEKWSQKYKSSINCSNPKGFSQKAHCAGRKKKVNESSGYSLSGSFTPDLIRSKVWLLKELSKIAPELDTVYVLGSWYGNLALYMHLQPTVDYRQIINVETDADMLNQSQRMLDHVGAERIEYMLKDANKLDYQQLGTNGAVINTSLTDMPGTAWFENIPAGTLVVMQARDRDPGEQYHSTQDIIDRFPLSQVYYTGTLDLQDPETAYQRFMVIGRK